MGVSNNWTTPITGEDHFREVGKRLMHEERRPRIEQASDILGPGIGPRATLITDWNAEAVLFNGMFYSLPGSTNSPDTRTSWIGQTLGTDDGFGTQSISVFRDAPLPAANLATWTRRFYTGSNGITQFTPWVMNAVPPSNTFIENPSFDVVDYTWPSLGARPGGWTNFWQSGTVITTAERNEHIDGGGSVKIVGTGNTRYQSLTVFRVVNFQTINFSIWAKPDTVGDITVGFMSQDSGIPNFFNGNPTLSDQSQTHSATAGVWRKYTYSWLVPAGHTVGRFSVVLSDTRTWYLDATEQWISKPPGGWFSFAPNNPNVPCTSNYAKFLRIGNMVTVRNTITLTAGIGPALIDTPFPFASDMLINDANLIGRVRAIRNGVAWYTGDIVPVQLSGPSRCAIMLDNGSGAQWSGANPATWAAGDRWGIDYTYEALPI